MEAYGEGARILRQSNAPTPTATTSATTSTSPLRAKGAAALVGCWRRAGLRWHLPATSRLRGEAKGARDGVAVCEVMRQATV